MRLPAKPREPAPCTAGLRDLGSRFAPFLRGVCKLENTQRPTQRQKIPHSLEMPAPNLAVPGQRAVRGGILLPVGAAVKQLLPEGPNRPLPVCRLLAGVKWRVWTNSIMYPNAPVGFLLLCFFAASFDTEEP